MKYIEVPVDTRAIETEHFSFRPNGPIVQYGEDLRENPFPEEKLSSGVTWSARLFVGFNVGGEPRYAIDDVVELVKKFRAEQGEAPDATFFGTRGLYTSYSTGQLVTEDSCQIIIIKINDAVTATEFRAQMRDLAGCLATEMKQDAVIYEMQRNGVSRGSYSVGQGTRD